MPEHHSALPPDHMLAEYRIGRVLGSGGFGITYYAWDTHLDKPVAVKEYLPNEFGLRADAGRVQPKSSDAAADFQWGLDRFLDEARTLARFEHPHINKVHRFFSANGTAYMVLEYIAGETLSAVLRRDARLAPARLQRLLAELLSALEEVHAANYVHRDVKPANIMLRGNGSAVLLDFGIARQAIGERSKSITAVATFGYAPIEQYQTRADSTGPWTDLYAVGMVAYRCVSGIPEGELPGAPERSAWRGKGEADKDLKPAVEVGEGVYNADFLGAVDHAIEVYENDRPQSVEEMREALGVVAAFLSVECKRLGERFLSRDFSPSAKDVNGWTDLHYAAAGNWVEVAQFLLDAGADTRSRVHMRDGDEDESAKVVRNTLNKIRNSTGIELHGGKLTPLHVAAQFGSYEVSRLLLENGASDAEVISYGYTPLHAATWGNADKVAALLLKNGADVGVNGNDRPLHIAAEANADKVAALLLKNGADIEAKSIGALGHHIGDTPLQVAAYRNADKVAAVLLKNGADIEARSADDQTPLHLAIWGGACKTAAVLLKNGADIEAKNDQGMTPLQYAAWESRGFKKTYEIAELLLKNGADVDARRSSDNTTPLHVAALAPGGFSSRVAAVLLKNGADIEAKAGNGSTPLHLAARIPDGEFPTTLLKNGANVEAKDERGQTPLHVTAAHCHTDKVAALLLKNEADIEAKDENGLTPLHVAVAENQFSKVVSLLLKNGADVSAKTNNDMVPLDIAAFCNASEPAILLLKNGADISAKTNYGWTPLHHAAAQNADKVAALLLKEGADIAAENDGGNTPLHYAAANNADKTMSLLMKNCEVVRWSMPGAVLANALDVVSHAMGVDDARKFLNGTLLEVADGKMRLRASNGDRLAEYTLDAPAGVDQIKCIVPRDTVQKAVQWLADAGDVDITLAKGATIMHKEGADLTSELIGGEFPEFKEIFATDTDLMVRVFRAEVLEALARLGVILVDCDTPSVKLDIGGEEMKLTVQNTEGEEGAETVSVKVVEGESGASGYNLSYLIDALQVVKEGEVDFCMRTEDGVLFVRVPGDESMLFFIMPLRL